MSPLVAVCRRFFKRSVDLALSAGRYYEMALANGYQIDDDDNLQCTPSSLVFGTMVGIQIL